MSLGARNASVMMIFDLFALSFWECGRAKKMESTGDSFWLSIRSCLVTDSQTFPVSLTGHQWKHSAVISTFGGGKTCSEFSLH